jgi:nucleoside-diphosphate-sugar epimerase
MTEPRASAPGPVVVSGASGFIGGAVLGALRRRNVPAIGVARKATSGPGERVVVADYRDTPCPAGAILVHLAEQATIPLANERGSAHVGEVERCVAALAAKGFRRIVYASSGQIYRAGDAAPDPYIAAKRAAEAIVLDSGGVVLRLANVYGPGMRHRTLIGDILRQIPGTEPLRILSAAPRRDFLWIDDAADGLLAAALGNAAGTFDLGSGETVSAGEVARLALAAAGESHRPIVTEIGPVEGDEEDAVVLDTARMAAAFGWRARVGLRDGLARMVRGAA